jgi:NADH-quinone oxidoreductase subunit J
MVTQIVTQVVFYIFAVAAVCSALMVVTAKNPVKSVLCLVLTFIAMAGIWVLLQAEFLALILIVVYVGAVMTLFLFVVMTMNLEKGQLKRGLVRYYPLALIVVILIAVMLFYVVGPAHYGLKELAAPAAASAHYSSVKALGLRLYGFDVYPFILAGALLLVAMIAAITLAFRGRRDRVQVSIKEQLQTTKADRLQVLQVPSEKGDKA